MRMQHLINHIERQCSQDELILNAVDRLTEVGTEHLTRERIETRLEALHNHWTSYSVQDDAIQLAMIKMKPEKLDEIKKHRYFQEKIFARVYDVYLESVEVMKIFLRDHQDRGQHASSASSVGQQSVAISVQQPRLPRIDIPKFDGALDKWLPFRDLFGSLVVANNSVSPIEKLQYLKTSLIGSASHLLNNTALTEENFDKAWKDVISFYENERLLVNSSMQALFSIRKITKESASELEHLYTSIMQVYRNLETLRRPVHCWDDMLVFLATQRLDSDTIKAWEHHLGPSKTPPTWTTFKEFLLGRMLSLQAYEKSQCTGQAPRSRQTGLRTHFTNTNGSAVTCPLCSEGHYLGKCTRYQAQTPVQRRELVIEQALCFNCLGTHRIAMCRSTSRCLKCGRRHHTLLHQDDASSVKRPLDDSKTVCHAVSEPLNASPTVLLATAQVRIRTAQGEQRHIRALLDQGSEVSLVTENLVQNLRLRREPSSVPILGIGSYSSGRTKGITRFTLMPHFDSSFSIQIEAHILPILTSSVPSSSKPTGHLKHLQGLTLADPNFSTPGHIDLIIGADLYGQLLDGAVLPGSNTAPTAQRTKLGWIISGPLSSSRREPSLASNHCSVDQDLMSLIEKFWTQEEIHNSKRTLSPSEQECEDHFMRTHSRDPTGRYIVQLPFNRPVNQLGTSRIAAERMLEHIQRKFQANHSFFLQYAKFLNEYEALEHMVKFSDPKPDDSFAFYLPHHGVTKETSTTTKLRVVFNGSCNTRNGVCLNAALHSGAKLQIDLFNVLLWQRRFKYIFSCDMKMMYRQIKLHPDDWKYQRILWKSSNGEVIIYLLTTVTYGLTCAPFLALRVIIQLVRDEGRRFPLAIDILLKGRYIDDVFGGADTINEAQRKAKEVEQLCLAGGFPLRKWVANHRDILLQIPMEHRTCNDNVPIQNDLIHALGLSWNPASDSFQFHLPRGQETPLTKRGVLSQIAKFFDPLGLMSPLFIKAKVFMQDLWILKTGWDDPLPHHLVAKWDQITKALDALEQIRIPR